MRTLAILLSAILACSLSAQSADAARKELAKKEAAAAGNPESLLRVGEWANANGLAAEAQRIWKRILEIDPAHAGANKALGHELVDGVWLSAPDAEKARKRVRDAEFAAKGLVEVDGVWLPKDAAEDARKGIFRVGNDRVTKGEFLALTDGKVRHPVTGELIEANQLEQAKGRQFPIGDENRWVDEQEADKHHSGLERPWLLRTKDYVFVSTLPIAKLESIKEHADRAIARVRPILGFAEALPGQRPAIFVAADTRQFRQLGNSMGDASSAFGAFLAQEQAELKIPLQGEVRPVICLWDDSWGPYNLPHATALALCNSVCAELDTEIPAWLLHGLGSFASRFESKETGAWFAQRLAKAGGLKDLATWMKGFTISGEMEFDDIDAAITQAGFLLSFCIQAGDPESTQALQAFTAAFSDRTASGIDRAAKALQAVLAGKQSQAADYLVKLVKQGG